METSRAVQETRCERIPDHHYRVDFVIDRYVIDLADNMRVLDRREITRQRPGMPVLEILQDAIAISVFSRCALVEDQVIAIWGLYIPRLLGDLGYPWCMTTELALDHKRFVMRMTKFYVARMRDLAPRLVAHVDSNYLQSLRWLQWAGFSTDEQIDVNGFPFTVVRMEVS